MARRAVRRQASAATNRRIARREQEEFAGLLRREIARGIQGSAIEIMNGLVKVGPAWSGQFSASWRFIPVGGSPGGPGEEGSIYRYTRNDLPVTLVEKYMKGGRVGPSTRLADVTRFEIVNTSSHANLAIDGEIDHFRRDVAQAKGWPEPLKDPTLGDERDNPSYRYEIGGAFSGSFNDAPASRTAEPDWYLTYLMGGGLQKDLDRGFSISLKGAF